jgi:polyisoprenyl-phosphate glycosyltransferase
MNLSIIIPVYNSSLILHKLIDEIHNVTKNKDIKKEIILINDCSKDNSWEIIRELADKFDFVKGINLEINYGQHNAIMAGLNLCSGQFCILMDDDMQHQPKYILEIHEQLLKGFKVCYVKYLKRKHLKWKIFVSWLNNIVASILALKPIKIYTSSFKGFNREITNQVIQFKKKEVFLDWLILNSSNNIAIIEILHQERFSGKTNYNLKRLLELWSIMIMNIETRTVLHSLWLILPKTFVRFFVYPFVKKININEQYKILDQTF